MRHYYGDTVVVSETIENTRFLLHRVYFVCILRQYLNTLSRNNEIQKFRKQTGSPLLSMNCSTKNIDISTKI